MRLKCLPTNQNEWRLWKMESHLSIATHGRNLRWNLIGMSCSAQRLRVRRLCYIVRRLQVLCGLRGELTYVD